jgi:glycosyltransferase involved in cell wall biosynthesis
MACGTPVVTSNTSSLPEIGGEAALYCDPSDTESLTTTLHRLLSDATLQEQLINQGLERAADFCWEQTARETQKVYDTLLS